MRYLVAVSGGVDSVVLLNILQKKAKSDGDELIVAHFDHGIRDDSADDARFVRALADRYELEFVAKRENLGVDCSEEAARKRRYIFFREQAKHFDAEIVTAHHRNDLVETVAINIYRGTGWRGLAVLSAEGIARPLLGFSKQDIYAYALRYKLEWVEDYTNRSDKYLRNRLRPLTNQLADRYQEELVILRRKQLLIRWCIDQQAEEILSVAGAKLSRYLFIMVDPVTALELLRAVIVKSGILPPTRPQLIRALHAIKVAQAGSSYQINGEITLDFNRGTFIVNNPL